MVGWLELGTVQTEVSLRTLARISDRVLENLGSENLSSK